MPAGALLDAARASLGVEVLRAERLEARARTEVTLAAAWFAGVQVAVTVGLETGMAPSPGGGSRWPARWPSWGLRWRPGCSPSERPPPTC